MQHVLVGAGRGVRAALRVVGEGDGGVAAHVARDAGLGGAVERRQEELPPRALRQPGLEVEALGGRA